MSQTDTICWADIPVKDLDRSSRFYSAVLGKPVRTQSDAGFDYGLLPHKNDNVSGCLVPANDNRPSETGPLVYLNVNGRMAEAHDAVKENGGTVLEDRHQIGPYGFSALIRDTEGNRIGLHSED